MAVDLVCGRTVDPKTALKRVHVDMEYFFHDKVCADAFVNDPLKYIDKSKSATSLEGRPVKRA